MSRTEAESPTAAELWRNVIEQLDVSDEPPEEDAVAVDRVLPEQEPLRGRQNGPTDLKRAAIIAANAIMNLASMLDVDIDDLTNEHATEDARANFRAHSHTLRVLARNLKGLAEQSVDSREH